VNYIEDGSVKSSSGDRVVAIFWMFLGSVWGHKCSDPKAAKRHMQLLDLLAALDESNKIRDTSSRSEIVQTLMAMNFRKRY
jgi:hypothetical protein